MSRILITGGAGFIGFGVAKALAARGDQVIAFDIARSPRLDSEIAQHRNIEFIQGEITEWPQVVALVQSRKPDAVVHCAAIVGVPNSLASPIGTFRVNVDGSLNVFEAMRLCGVRRVVNLSSEETYGIFDKDKIDRRIRTGRSSPTASRNTRSSGSPAIMCPPTGWKLFTCAPAG